ncbi:MAG: ABC transporter ATP-binding protein [Fastidiosipila sp.]|nr:ABC transporter ATP-binding protein [Fastidiosipila sp.]
MDKDKSGTLKFLLARFKEHLGMTFLGGSLLLLSAFFALVPPILIKETIEQIANADGSYLFIMFLLIIGSSLIRGVLYYGQRIVLERVGQTIVHQLRTETIRHINNLSFAFFDDKQVGDLVARVTSDTDLLANFYGFTMVNVINNILTLLGILIVLLVWSPLLALAFIVLLPFIVHAMYKYSVTVKPLTEKIRKSFGQLTASVQQTFNGIETVKLLGTEDYEAENFDKSSGGLLDRNVSASKITSLWMPYVHFLVALGTALTLFWGGYLTIQGTISLGMLIGFISYMAMLVRPIRQTGMQIGVALNSIAAGSRVHEVLLQEQEDLDSGQWFDEFKGQIEIENVSFTYQASSKKAIKDLSLTIPAGKKLALVGPSGSGKSTLINLILGFYKPQKGSIKIDGLNLDEVNLRKLRTSTGHLSQDPFIFDGTILENITFGNPEASLGDVNEAIDQAILSDFVQSLPKGVNTHIGEKGVRLSGGQKQRLAMARVLITNPKILILDEPTSSLDKKTEDELQKSLANVMKSRTVITIAHRLWTIQNSDIIAFMNQGTIEDSGTHAYLLDNLSLYRDFVESQIFTVGEESS